MIIQIAKVYQKLMSTHKKCFYHKHIFKEKTFNKVSTKTHDMHLVLYNNIQKSIHNCCIDGTHKNVEKSHNIYDSFFILFASSQLS